MERIQNPMKYTSEDIRCSLTNFFGYSVAYWSTYIVLLIPVSYNRYRAICHPFTIPLSGKKTRLLWLGMGVMSFCLATPVIFIYGVRTFSLPDDLNGSECGIKDAMKPSYIPSFYYGLVAIIYITMVGLVGWFYYNIWRTVRKAKKTKKALTEVVFVKEKYMTHDKVEHENRTHANDTNESIGHNGVGDLSGITLSNLATDTKTQVTSESSGSIRNNHISSCFSICLLDQILRATEESGQSSTKFAESNVDVDTNIDHDLIYSLPEPHAKKGQGPYKYVVDVSKENNKNKIFSKRRNSSSKVTRTAIIITVMSFFCYTIMILSLIIQSFLTEEETTRAFRYLFHVFFINNIFNPAVYLLSDPRFQSGLKKMYHCH